MKECLAKKLFGLPAPHFSYVRNIKPGMPLFLFNYSDRKLHGIFEAASPGRLNIDPHGWAEDGSDTLYAAQVKMQIKIPCQPLAEDQFGPIISENYYDPGLFWFELDREQTGKLISLLSSSPIPRGNNLFKKTETGRLSRAASASHASSLEVARPIQTKTAYLSDASASCMESSNMKTVTENSIQVASQVQQSSGLSYSSVLKSMSSSKNSSQHAHHLEEEVGKEDVVHVKSNDNQSSSAGGNKQKKWSSLFGTENTTSTGKKFEILTRPVSEAQVTYSDCTSTRWDSKSIIPPTGNEMQVDSIAHVAPVQCEEKYVNLEPNYQSVSSSTAANMNTFLPLGTIGGITRHVVGHVGEKVIETNSASSEEDYMDKIHSYVQPYLDGQSESSVSPRAELAVNFSGKDIQFSKDISFPGTNISYPTGSSFDYQSVLAKLVQEVEELKFSKVQYIHKINTLEQDLANSRQEFQQLKDQFKLLKMGHTAEVGSQSSYEGLSNLHEWMFIVGGYNGNSWLVDLDLYSSNDLLKPLCPMGSTRSYASAAMLNGELYVFGGASGHTWYDTVESYNPSTNQWVSRPALNQRKGSLAGVSLNEKIFAIGGGNGVDCFSEVEMFDQHTGKWTQSRPMLHKRFSAAAASYDGVIYVTGGFDGINYLKSMERFDPRERSWVELGSMSMKRACHSVAVLDNTLYALGGYDGSKMMPTVESYDLYMNKWMMEESMKHRRGYFSSIVIKNAIYAIGGMSGNNEVLDEVEYYKNGLGWQTSDLKSIGKRAFYSAVKL